MVHAIPFAKQLLHLDKINSKNSFNLVAFVVIQLGCKHRHWKSNLIFPLNELHVIYLSVHSRYVYFPINHKSTRTEDTP